MEGPVHVDLQCAESFVVLGEEMHYGRAAARLYVTPPGLSRRIQRLETQLSTKLVVRGPSGVVVLTPAGTRALDDLTVMLAREARLRQAVRQPRTTVAGGGRGARA